MIRDQTATRVRPAIWERPDPLVMSGRLGQWVIPDPSDPQDPLVILETPVLPVRLGKRD